VQALCSRRKIVEIIAKVVGVDLNSPPSRTPAAGGMSRRCLEANGKGIPFGELPGMDHDDWATARRKRGNRPPTALG
jgi:hypothetical protein